MPRDVNTTPDAREKREALTERQTLEARETLAADEVPEVEFAVEEDELEANLEAHATEEIVGDVDGDDYRAGTLDPEGSDRGPWNELSGERLDRGLDRVDKRW
jgi:hypothetical protein